MTTRTPRACASYLAALPSTRAIPDRDVFYLADPISSIETRSLPALAHSYPRRFTFHLADPVSSIVAYQSGSNCQGKLRSGGGDQAMLIARGHTFKQEQPTGGVRLKCMTNRVLVFAVAVTLLTVASVCADDNVREVQTKLHDAGFYRGEIDGAYSSQLTAALSRYQIRNGLPITGQLDAETSKALGAKPAVTTTAAEPAQSSEARRQLRKRDQGFLAKTNARAAASPSANETPGTSTGTTNDSAEKAATTRPGTQSADSSLPQEPPSGTAPISADARTSSPAADFSAERVRDYVAAFVLAGLDRQAGAEIDFFADRAAYYDSGMISREKIRQDLQRYAERWPERQFWIAGNISVEPQSENRVRVTFPLEFKLRNGTETTSGKVDKSLILEAAGDDLQIVAVSERKAE